MSLRLLALLSFFLLGNLCLTSPAAAERASMKLISAPMVSPSAAWTYYGSATTHTNLLSAWSPVDMKAMARSLGADRIASSPNAQQITADQYAANAFDYVRNNIDTEFRFGLSKGGHGALIDRSAGPFDQAELLVMLLREAGLTASYRVGTIQLTAEQFGKWSGLVKNLNSSTQSFDVDARAACQFLADGGIPGSVQSTTSSHTSDCSALTGNLVEVIIGHIWVVSNGKAYDPSFKRYRLEAGIDLAAAMGCGTASSPTCGTATSSAYMSGAVQGTLAGAPTIKSLNATAAESLLQGYAVALENHIKTNLPGAPVENVVGGQRLDTSYSPTIGSTLSYEYGSPAYSWSGEIPNQFRTHVIVITDHINDPTDEMEFYGDEAAGRRFFGPWTSYHAIMGVSATINHPYAAQTGSYGDITLELGHPPPGMSSEIYGGWLASPLFVQFGRASAATQKFYSELENAYPPPVGEVGRPQGSIQAAQVLAQQSQAQLLVERLYQAKLNVHSIIGFASQGAMHLSTSVSANSQWGDSAAVSAAHADFALIQATLEGSIFEQTQNSWPTLSYSRIVSTANSGGAEFVEVTPANFSAVSGYLAYLPVALQPFVDDNQTLIIPRTPFGSNVLAYDAQKRAYMVGVALKGGGGAPSPVEPARATLDSINQTPASLRAREGYSIDVAEGVLTLSPPPDLVTGAGAFPHSLPFQRTYRSPGQQEYVYADFQDYAETDAKFYARLGGGWTHNYQIGAALSGDGALGMGSERGLDAARAIAGLYVMRLQGAAPSFANRLSAVLVADWISRGFVDNRASVDKAGQSVTFARLPSGGFAQPRESSETLIQSGTRTGPVGVVFDGSVPLEWAYDYAGVSLSYTDKDGAEISFTPNQTNSRGWTSYMSPTFNASAWTFPDGVKLAFAYTAVHRPGWYFTMKRLDSVSNNLGRSLSFTTTDHFITRVTDETGRYASYTTCGENYLYCDLRTVTTPDGGVTKYDYEPNSASPAPNSTDKRRPSYRLRRWYTPTDGSTPYMTFKYDQLSRLSEIVDVAGRVSKVYPAGLGGEFSKTGVTISPEGAVSRTSFDDKNRPTKVVDPLQRVTTTVYDDQARITTTTLPEQNKKVETRDLRGNVIEVREVAKPGSGLADIVSATTYTTGATTLTCSNHKICNKPISIDGPRTDVTDVTDYSWDSTYGLLTQIKPPADANGIRPQTDLSYSAFGPGGSQFRLLTSKTDKISSSDSVATTYSYNTSNKYVLKEAIVDPSGLNLRTCFKFDTTGNLTSTSDPRTGTCP